MPLIVQGLQVLRCVRNGAKSSDAMASETVGGVAPTGVPATRAEHVWMSTSRITSRRSMTQTNETIRVFRVAAAGAIFRRSECEVESDTCA
jgi:hypothetical protein